MSNLIDRTPDDLAGVQSIPPNHTIKMAVLDVGRMTYKVITQRGPALFAIEISAEDDEILSMREI